MGPGEKTPEEETPEEKTLEELYLKDLSCCSPPDNCCRDCICIYSNPCGSQCVDGLMHQQLLEGDMSREKGGWTKLYCYESCYQFLFPCVISEGFWRLSSLSGGGTSNSTRDITKAIAGKEVAIEIRGGLIHKATGQTNIIIDKISVHSGFQYCIPCNNAAYVIKKNEENRAEKLITKGPPLSPFTASGPGELQTLLAVPGTRRMEFMIR